MLVGAGPGLGCWGGRSKVPFLTVLSTFLPTFSSANGFANGTNAPIGIGVLIATSPLLLLGSVGAGFSTASVSNSEAVTSPFVAGCDEVAVGGDCASSSAGFESVIVVVLGFLSFFSFLLLLLVLLCTPSLSDRFSFFSFLRSFLSGLVVEVCSFAIVVRGVVGLAVGARGTAVGFEIVKFRGCGIALGCFGPCAWW